MGEEHKAKNKNNEFNENNEGTAIRIFFWVGIVLFLVALIRAIAMYCFEYNSNVLEIENLIKSMLIILGMFSTNICLLYYSNTRKEEMFIASLLYLVGTVDVILVDANHMINAELVLNYEVDTVILNSVFKIIIAIVILSSMKRVKEFMCNNRSVVFIFVVILSAALNILEGKDVILQELKYRKPIAILYLFLVVVFLVLLILFIKKSIREKESAYIPIIISIGSSALYYIYVMIDILKVEITISDEVALIAICGLVMVNISLLIEYSKSIILKREVEDKNKIFYRLIDENSYSNIVLCNERLEPIYCNKIVREFYEKQNNIFTYANIKESFKENIKLILEEVRVEMWNEINKSGSWSGIVDTGSSLKGKSEVVKWTVQRIYTNDNEVLYSFMFIDITNEYKALQELDHVGKKLHTVVDNIKEMIVVVDVTGYITYINNSVGDILKYDESEIVGKHVRSFIENSNFYKNKHIDVKGQVFEVDVIAKDGTLIKLEATASSVAGKEEEEIYFVCRDSKTRDDLEKLKEKYIEKEHYDNIRNEYFANLSHELRTPLNVIYSSLQLLNSKIDDEEKFMGYYKKYNETLKQNCFRTLKLANNLIDISRIEAGYEKLESINTDIVSLVENITMELVEFVEGKRINLIFDTDVEELIIGCDKSKIEKAVLNLLSNAIKYVSEEGNISVNIESSDDFVAIRVKDDGIGIPKAFRSIIFEKFVQVDKGLNRLKEGSGVGLTLVKYIAELHGGSVALENYSEVGCDIVMKLPNEAIKERKTEFISKNMVNKTIKEKISIHLSDIYDI